MDISSLIDRPSETPESRPPISRRQTVSSLLNDDNPAYSSRNNSVSSIASGSSGKTESAVRSGPKKPRRYDIPPIYAQSWLRTQKSAGFKSTRVNGSGSDPSRTNAPYHRSSRAAPIAHPASSSSTPRSSGLPVSLTGIVPFEDLTRKVTEWIYSHLFQLGDERQYVEVEFKFGSINDKSTEKRITMPVLTETILRPDYSNQQTFFNASMSDELFSRANTFLDSLLDDKSENVTKIMTKSKDDIFDSRKQADKLRVSYDEAGNVIAKINKKRISDMAIFSPGDLLDFRISLSVEIPSTEDESKRKSSVTRHKNRQSFLQDGLQVDLTSVIRQPGQHQNNKLTTSKELEIELNTPKLLGYFNAFQSKSDPLAMDKFEELVGLGLNNTRLIARKLSR